MIVHACFFDRECWRDWWDYGAPMQIRVGSRLITVPFFANAISKRRWEPEPTATITAAMGAPCCEGTITDPPGGRCLCGASSFRVTEARGG